MSSLSSLRQSLVQAQEKARDLSQENSILRESNEQLLASAFDLEKERAHLSVQNALRVQIAQLETTLREGTRKKEAHRKLGHAGRICGRKMVKHSSLKKCRH
jgi:hypothetical protein